MQIHVDPLGGWSGDMFVAACLDAFPAFWPDVEAAIAVLRLGPSAACRLIPHRDGTLTGRRFQVEAEPQDNPEPRVPQGHHHADDDHRHDEHGHTHEEPHSHGSHRAWRDIRDHLSAVDLDRGVANHAIGIFQLLADAEGEVHGVEAEAVAFHEVGAVDSIVDIVAAAVLIMRIGATRWSSAPLPLGGGRVKTAHGILPVPAPATALLLRGLDTIDDGVTGERVTPTGAAVARYLLGGSPPRAAVPRRLRATGTGFGTRTLPGMSNCLRILAFEEAEQPSTSGGFAHRELGVIEFEVDDQSAEDLSHGLDHLRALDGVHDVIQSVAFGKKGRMASHIQVLVAPRQLDAAIAACLTETTTIGLRFHTVQGAALPRGSEDVVVDGHALRVKIVTRPDGSVTGKTEAADVATQAGHAARVSLRWAGEAAALARLGQSPPKAIE